MAMPEINDWGADGCDCDSCLCGDSVCHCPCHKDESIKHAAPCCVECPFCKKRIRLISFNEHLAQHKKH